LRNAVARIGLPGPIRGSRYDGGGTMCIQYATHAVRVQMAVAASKTAAPTRRKTRMCRFHNVTQAASPAEPVRMKPIPGSSGCGVSDRLMKRMPIRNAAAPGKSA
jgi:hypothetical protein